MSGVYYDFADVAEEEQRRREKERENAERLGGVVEQLSRTRDGAFFLRWVLNECGVWQQEVPRDSVLSAFNSGRRAFGLQILEICAAKKITAILFDKEPNE